MARAGFGYNGFYSGTLSTGATVGIYVNTNSDLIVVVVDPANSSYGASTNGTITPGGALSGTYLITPIKGQFAPDGKFDGTATAFGITISAQRAPNSGATASYQGCYQGWVFDPNNRQLAITVFVSADGQYFQYVQDGTTVVDAAFGTISAGGVFNIRDGNNRTANGSVITTANGATLNGRYTKAGVGGYNYVVGLRTATHHLINIATRGNVSPGAGALVAGFVINGGAKTVLVRGLGPSLAPFGITGFVADPQLTLYDGSAVIATNDNWNTQTGGLTAADIRSGMGSAGAFALAENSLDAVLLLRLEPGSYTAQLSGANNSSGIGLIEVYEVP